MNHLGLILDVSSGDKSKVVALWLEMEKRDTLIGHVRVYTGVYTEEVVQELMRIAVMFEEKVYASATSLQDHLQKISFKMRTIDIRYQNRVTNPLLPNAASSGPNAHGAEMTTEAVSYETISGPVVSDGDEDAEDVSKEDSLEEVAMTKEQKSAVGHKENVKVGENEVICVVFFVVQLPVMNYTLESI
ncbi:hypothetical protein BC332_12835 [Capsicum chinense]|nr:hypothetical protein BC332_12835 [Capsicum chinense]